MMQVSKEEVLKMANLAHLEISDNEVESYLTNLQEILNFADIINNAKVDGVDVTVASNQSSNIFRKDEIKTFEDNEALFVNAKSKEQNMFKIPKVIN